MESSTYISLKTNNSELKIVGALASVETLVIETGRVRGFKPINTSIHLSGGLIIEFYN